LKTQDVGKALSGSDSLIMRVMTADEFGPFSHRSELGWLDGS
jgi:hypothetical protein